MNAIDLEIQKLQAISLLDGRNRDKMQSISEYFSEFALIKRRIQVELEYLIFLSKNTKIVRTLNSSETELLSKIFSDFTPKEALKVKRIEAKINHDVKSVEYYLGDKLKKTKLKDIVPFIHFGLTSYDINIPAYALMLSEVRAEVLFPKLNKLFMSLEELIKETKNMPMLARTHGQPAVPTTLGKELAVFYQRLKNEAKILNSLPIEAKLTGAVGNFNACYFVKPEYDWIDLSKKFIKSLGLIPNIVTTQIMPYDNWLRIFDSVKRLNNIFLNLVQDIWWYISFEYFLQKKKNHEVGSSTMAHKINPITFENAEGNLQLANSLFEFFVRKLSISRLQRDLSDSTIKRDFGLAFGFTILAWDSIVSGLSKIVPDPVKMLHELDNHWEVFSEGVQTFLRTRGLTNAFEILKEKTRGAKFTKKEFLAVIDRLPVDRKIKNRLKIDRLSHYLGYAEKIVDLVLQEKI